MRVVSPPGTRAWLHDVAGKGGWTAMATAPAQPNTIQQSDRTLWQQQKHHQIFNNQTERTGNNIARERSAANGNDRKLGGATPNAEQVYNLFGGININKYAEQIK